MDHIYEFQFRFPSGREHSINLVEPSFEIAARDAISLARERGWTLISITDEDEA